MVKKFYILLFISNIISFHFYSQNPGNISNLKLWVNGSNVIENAGKISQLTDQSGNNHDLTQSTSSRQPELVNNGIGSNPVIRFNGGQVVKGAFNSTYNQPGTYYVLMKSTSTSNQYVFDGFNSFNTLQYWIQGMRYFAGGVIIGYPSPFPLDYSIYTVVVDGANSKILENGVLKVQGTLNPNTVDGMTLGGYHVNGGFFFGDIAEVVYYDKVLTAAEDNDVLDYFYSKYAPPVDLGPDTTLYSLCNFYLKLESGYSNVLWSTGESEDSILISESGTYFVQGTNIFGVTSYDTIAVTLPSIPSPSKESYCVGQSLTWDADLGPDYTYEWSTGATTPSLTIFTPTTVWVELTDTNGCMLRSDTLFIQEDDYSIFLGNDTTICSGNAIQLVQGNNETDQYIWSDGSTDTVLHISNSGTYWVDGTNINGCTLRDSINVTISGIAPTVQFSTSQFCQNLATDFTDQSTSDPSDQISTVLWTFGDGNQSNQSITSHQYADSGIYNVKLYAETVGGCADSLVKPISILKAPEADFTVDNNCLNDSVIFHNTTLSGSGAINLSNWNFGDPGGSSPNTSTIENPKRIYEQLGNFEVSLIVEDLNNCRDTVTSTITILPIPNVDFNIANACLNDIVNISDNSTMPAPYIIQNYNWEFGDGTSSLDNSPEKFYSAFDAYEATLTLTSDNGCTSSQTDSVIIHPLPSSSFENGPACASSFTAFNSTSIIPTGTIKEHNWTFELVEETSGMVTYHSFSEPGQNFVRLTTVSDSGCTNTINSIIDVNDSLTSDWEVGLPIILNGIETPFIYTGVGAENFQWQFGGLVSDTNANPVIILQGDSSINVQLIASNSVGCADTLEKTLLITDPILDIELGNIDIDEEDGFYTISIQLTNQGTAPINSTEVQISLSNGINLKESWNNVINYNETKAFSLTAKPSAQQSELTLERWICAYATPSSVIDISEEVLDNNDNCTSIEIDSPVLIGPFPNPVEDMLQLTLVMKTTNIGSLYLSDNSGRIIREFSRDQKYSKGANKFEYNVSNIRSGVYYLKFESEDNSITKTVVIH